MPVAATVEAGKAETRCCCSGALLPAVDRPAGAGVPSLVTAVAVVRLRATVLCTTSTNTASSRAMPPPSCADTLFTTVLLLIVIRPRLALVVRSPLACRTRIPPPSSLAMLEEITLWSMETGPVPCVRPVGVLGSSPATITPPPSSYEPLNQTRLPLIRPPVEPW